MYSTNPHTVKARQRKMNLNGAKKVEDAARTADYKAMLYARKTVQSKPSYTGASESEKSAMLEAAMRDTMEKRRSRGQDTMSKMAAFRAGTYRDRDSTTGPQTRVPISAFLQDNGFVPSRPSRAPQRGVTAEGGAGVGSAFSGANGLPNIADHRRVSAPALQVQGNDNPFEIQGPPSPVGVKASATPGPFANMSPEPAMLASVEGDAPMGDANDSLARMQMEMGHLRTLCQNAVASNNSIRELDLGNVQAQMGMDRNRVQDLAVRVSQMEGMMNAMQNTSLGNVVDRVNELESAVEELKNKVGSGCEAEVAKMREVIGGLKNALDKVGGFV